MSKVWLELAMSSKKAAWFVEPLKEVMENAGLQGTEVDFDSDNDRNLKISFANDVSSELAEALTYELLDAVGISDATDYSISSEKSSVFVTLDFENPSREFAGRPIDEGVEDDEFDDEDTDEVPDSEEEEDDEEDATVEEEAKPKKKTGLAVLRNPEARKLIERLHTMACGDDYTHLPQFWQDIDSVCDHYRGESGFNPEKEKQKQELKREIMQQEEASADMFAEWAADMYSELAKKKGKGKKKWKEGYGGFLTAFMTVCAGKRDVLDKVWTDLDDERLVEIMIAISQSVVGKVTEEREKRGMDENPDEIDEDEESKPQEESAAKKAYYVLAIYHKDTERWEVDLGSYDRSDVVDQLDNSLSQHKRKDMKILSLSDANQKTIDSAMENLNGKPQPNLE